MRVTILALSACLSIWLLVACAGSGIAANKPLAAALPNSKDRLAALHPEAALSQAAFEEKVSGQGGRVNFVFGSDRPFAQCHASTLAEAPNGHLVAAWFAGTEEKNPDVGIWMACFDGTGWSAPRLAAKVADCAHWNPVLFTDKAGLVHLFFKVGPEIPGWKTWWMSSSDNGATWSAPTELVPGDAGGRGPVKNKPIILSDGSWLAPASTEHDLWESFVDRSTDGGVTWERSPDFPIDRTLFRGDGTIQPTLWESAPGNVHALLRSTCGAALRSDSGDNGRTWSPVYDSGLPNNNSGLDVLWLEDGRLLLVLNPVGVNWGPRTPLSLALSKDNGATWSILAHLEDAPVATDFEFSYPAIIRTRDGVAVSYTYKREQVRCWMIPLAAL